MAEKFFALKSEKSQRFLCFLLEELNLRKPKIIKIQIKKCLQIFDTPAELIRYLMLLESYEAIQPIKIENKNIDLAALRTLSRADIDHGLHSNDIIILDCNEKQIFKLYREACSNIQTNSKRKNVDETQHLIYKNSDGDYFWKDKPIDITKNTIHYLILDCLYENGDVNGFCDYSTIDKYFSTHGKGQYKNQEQTLKRIRNGVASLFRFSNLKSTTPDGKKLIRKLRGEGLIFHNPVIKK